MCIDASGCTALESIHLTTNKPCYVAKQDTTKERGERMVCLNADCLFQAREDT